MPRRSYIEDRTRTLRPVFGKLGISEQHLGGIARMPNVTGKINRLRTLAQAGVPLKGLTFKLALGEGEFQKLLTRHRSPYKLTDRQRSVLTFLVNEKHLPSELAIKIASRRNSPTLLIPEKIAFFESFKLDSGRYGVERIPPAYYAPLLPLPFSQIKAGIKKRILWILEDAQSAKILDANFPNWRQTKSFFPKRGKVRPTKILKRLVESISGNIEPAVDTVLYPSIAKKRRAKLMGKVKVLSGSKIGARFKLHGLESRLSELNGQIETYTRMVPATSSERAILAEELQHLKDKRTELIRRRNELLAKYS